MAPIKFEDNIREKLEAREIQPSKDAWKKLSERLDENSEKKNKYTIWYAIAASIIGVLIAVSVFNNRGASVPENPTDFVEINTSEFDKINEKVPATIENSSEIKDKAIVVAEESDGIRLKKITDSGQEGSLPKKKNLVLKNTKNGNSEAIAKTSRKNQIEEMSQLPEEIITNDELIADKQISELVAQVELALQDKETVSEEEINTLLTNAGHKINAKEIHDSNKIDPAVLLGDVELEMEYTFREKVFSALGEGYNIIKTAVVDRNN